MNLLVKMSVLGVFFLVAGCDTVKTELGLNRHIPDEFSVMQRAPLEIPADLNTLPVPQPGASRPQEVAAKEQAKGLLLGDQKTHSIVEKPSVSEKVLMNKVGGGAIDSNVREKLTTESQSATKDNRPVVKRILGIGKENAGSRVVDAEAEAKRIQDAKKAGKPITDGITPSLEE